MSEAFEAVVARARELRAGHTPPDFGHEDPDLLGRVAGDLSEPPRDPDSAWY